MADTKDSTTKTMVTAYGNSLRLSPRKMRLVTNLVNKRMPVQMAITQLKFVHKKGADMLIKVFESALANAEHNFSLKPEELVVKQVTCDMGQVMKRSFPRARGSASLIRRKTSHVQVVLESMPGVKAGKAKGATSSKRKIASATPVGPDVLQQSLPQDAKVETSTIKTSEQMKQQRVAQKRRPDAE